MTEQEMFELYQSITVTIPGLDPIKAKAINFDGFSSALKQVIQKATLLGKQDGLKNANDIVTETFQAARLALL